ncbi:lytic transglycosylase domain-containing protein [Jannaschia sp. M317]|uniref:lytic transglycosylase domain-containing protein n=1 Tax=Jannaschia sp. M317 TaxID=2867011 RepID=UPI0021A5D542|nr:lytic transglycosylase domain-containing protein [Jannaschia sp. M317]UWQ17527.1 lytic transglycosylase domain-containing protein [Jannaschia sp. M317]
MTRIFAAFLAFALVAAPISGPALAGEFTFKRVKPPSSNTTRRITVQITAADRPVSPSAPITAPRPSAPQAPDVAIARTAPAEAGGRSNQQDWFWTAVSPAIAPQAGRFLQATRVAARPPDSSGIRAPSLRHLQRIAQSHGDTILRHSVGTRVSPALILALISVESAGRTDAISHAGAQGLMQLIPATAERFGITDANDPGQNIRAGVAYLDWLMKEFGGDPVLALAGYNAGEGAVRRHEGVPPYAETRAYVPKVLAAWNVARMMCKTPPTMPGDGCVFDAAFEDT